MTEFFQMTEWDMGSICVPHMGFGVPGGTNFLDRRLNRSEERRQSAAATSGERRQSAAATSGERRQSAAATSGERRQSAAATSGDVAAPLRRGVGGALRASTHLQGVAFGECFVMAQRSAPSTTASVFGGVSRIKPNSVLWKNSVIPSMPPPFPAAKPTRSQLTT